jgi:tetratricopeptide (TPR) repeat protein
MAIKFHNKRARLFLKIKRYEQSIRYFDKALKLNSNNPEANRNKGIALFYLNKFEESSAYLDKAIMKLNERDSIVYHIKGKVLSKMKKFQEAYDSYKQAIKINPECYKSYNNISNVLKHLNRREEAIQCLNKSIELKKSCINYFNKANCLKELHRDEETLICLNKAIKLCRCKRSNSKHILNMINFKGDILKKLD